MLQMSGVDMPILFKELITISKARTNRYQSVAPHIDWCCICRFLGGSGVAMRQVG